MADETADQIKTPETALKEKSEQVKSLLNKSKSDDERLKREKDELKGSIEAEAEKTCITQRCIWV